MAVLVLTTARVVATDNVGTTGNVGDTDNVGSTGTVGTTGTVVSPALCDETEGTEAEIEAGVADGT